MSLILLAAYIAIPCGFASIEGLNRSAACQASVFEALVEVHFAISFLRRPQVEPGISSSLLASKDGLIGVRDCGGIGEHQSGAVQTVGHLLRERDLEKSPA